MNPFRESVSKGQRIQILHRWRRVVSVRALHPSWKMPPVLIGRKSDKPQCRWNAVVKGKVPTLAGNHIPVSANI